MNSNITPKTDMANSNASLESKLDSKIDIGIPNDSLGMLVNFLNLDLADEYVLLTKTKNYHWNVIDPRFNDIHEFLKVQYELLDEMIDELAERIRSIGGRPIGTLKEFIEQTRLPEHPNQYPTGDKMLENILSDHESIIRQIRKDIERCEQLEDIGTADFLTEVIQKHEKMAWMLRSFIELYTH